MLADRGDHATSPQQSVVLQIPRVWTGVSALVLVRILVLLPGCSGVVMDRAPFNCRHVSCLPDFCGNMWSQWLFFFVVAAR